MSLLSFCDDNLTDKNRLHSYIEIYEELFNKKRETATHILEIGIGPCQPNGGSILMWSHYFKNADIHTVDIIPFSEINKLLYDHSRIYIHINDAYDYNFFQNAFLSKSSRYDIIIDDGPHTLESMINFIQMYSKVLKNDGILVVEDVQSMDWIPILKACTPIELKPYIEVYDRRHIKNRWDDIIFVINKSIQL
jgi:cephalosporin hydroxylase